MLGAARRAVCRGRWFAVLVAASGCSSNEPGSTAASAGSGAVAGGGAAAGGMSDGGSGPAAGGTSAGGNAGSVAVAGEASSAGTGGSGGMPCAPVVPLTPSGADIDVTPPMKLADALGKAMPGDRVVLHAGTYTSESISKLSFAKHVFVQAAEGDEVTLPGLRFTSCDHVVLEGVHVDGTLELEGSSDFVLRKVVLTGQGEDAALQFQGQHAAGATHDVVVEDSTIRGGGRTVFILGKFAPAEAWNHHLIFRRNAFMCGSHNCFQISGGRDIDITVNGIQSESTAGVLTAGATRVNISRNLFIA